MRKFPKHWLSVVVVVFAAVALTGCGSWKSPKMAEYEQKITTLETQLAQANEELNAANSDKSGIESRMTQLERDKSRELDRLRKEKERELARLRDDQRRAVRKAEQKKEREAEELIQAQKKLARSLQKELGDAKAKLEMTERGLVLTFLDEIFFDSGKATVKEDGVGTLDKVAQVLQSTVPDSQVAVEGHTDNVPIKYSGWKSNWELSSARALAVVHSFVESHDVAPDRLRAVGFGEYSPVADNASAEGRRQNRRVEVVILPKQIAKQQYSGQ